MVVGPVADVVVTEKRKGGEVAGLTASFCSPREATMTITIAKPARPNPVLLTPISLHRNHGENGAFRPLETATRAPRRYR